MSDHPVTLAVIGCGERGKVLQHLASQSAQLILPLI
jgi:hypothetical protein